MIAQPIERTRFKLRPYRGEVDLPDMLDAYNASHVVDGMGGAESLENMRNTYTHLANCDIEKDITLAEVDGEVVGYSRSEWRQLQAGGRVYTFIWYLNAAGRGIGVEEALLEKNETRLWAVSADHPLDGPRWLQSFAAEGEAYKVATLEQAGYEIVRMFYDMERPNLDNIPDAPLPEGLELRPVRPEQFRTIWDAFGEFFKDHWGEEELGEDDFERFHGSVECQPEIWKVAWDVETNEVAGGVLGFINEAQNAATGRKRGWTENIAVARKWRKRGVARALMAENLRELKARGMTEAALGVDTENLTGALRVYESMGFEPVRTVRVYRKAMR